MRLKVIFFVLLAIVTVCSKKRKVELKQDITVVSNKKVESYSKKLTPKLFFQITGELNRLTEKYDRLIKESSTNNGKRLVEQLNNAIEKIYSKYNTSETEMNIYSETHYREMEKYLEEHPEAYREVK